MHDNDEDVDCRYVTPKHDSGQLMINFQSSFDQFTVELTGKKYNGMTTTWDTSGGMIGRLEDRVKNLEDAAQIFKKAQRNMAYTIAFILFLQVLGRGMTNADKIYKFFEAIGKLF